jgi:hypothetical protein
MSLEPAITGSSCYLPQTEPQKFDAPEVQVLDTVSICKHKITLQFKVVTSANL